MTCANCSRGAFADGLCTSCYAKRRRGTLKQPRTCAIIDCDHPAVIVLPWQDTALCETHRTTPDEFPGIGIMQCSTCNKPQSEHALADYHGLTWMP